MGDRDQGRYLENREGDIMPFVLNGFSQPLQEIEHFCRLRQKKVGKIVQHGPPLFPVKPREGLVSRQVVSSINLPNPTATRV